MLSKWCKKGLILEVGIPVEHLSGRLPERVQIGLRGEVVEARNRLPGELEHEEHEADDSEDGVIHNLADVKQRRLDGLGWC